MVSNNHWKRRLRTFPAKFYYFLQILFVLIGLTTDVKGEIEIKETDVSDWATHFGYQINEVAKYMTYVQDIRSHFQDTGAYVRRKDGAKMVMDMSSDIEKMMAWKIQAVQRITETAEQAMMGHVYNKELKLEYNNAKTINKEDRDGNIGIELPLIPDKHFYSIPVDINNSSIHVPTNVYDKAADVLNAIRWSEHLNPIFQSNYHLDPSLNWQYFGSSTGFLRQYPAMKWGNSETVDTYDCRMRPWYIEAATSPKDMVILMDASGSMTGLRKEIAKHVALNILDTLNDDDYFTIYSFSETVNDLVPCFNSSLVPANMENIREFKKGLQNITTENIANFTRALSTAFEILQRYNRSGDGSLCNQAIMLITDGAPQMYEDVFNYYNQPLRQIRVFTYMIGQEMADEREVEWMACTNRGYYSHVSTIAEARDQVQNYIPVMARPLVLHQKHNVIWTAVYADIEDPKMSDFLWEKGEKANQRILLVSARMREYMPNDEGMPPEEFTEYPDPRNYTTDAAARSQIVLPIPASSTDINQEPFRESTPTFYRLMTTVAYPVFDRCNYTSKVAQLLGVAGTDVPIEEIIKLAPPYKLGVNGYAFGITNNGYILFHPDLRPVYASIDDLGTIRSPPILKPDYNSVDLAEAELRDNDLPPRGYDTLLLMLRKKMIDREVNHTKMGVKIHQDGMRRVVTRVQEYFFAPLKDTPFSFGIAMPEGYGQLEIVGQVDLKDKEFKHLEHYRKANLGYNRSVLSLFEHDGNWTIHPDWVYCRYLYSNPNRTEQSREQLLTHFLLEIHDRTFTWDNHHRVKPLPKNEDYSYSKAKKINKNEFYCDKELIQSLVFDANATKIVARRGRNNKTRKSTAAKNSISVVFVATRTGLTRWEDFDADGRNFILRNNRAIDELWYRRAVDYHATDDKSFVYSVPFDAGARNNTSVTASYAIFLNHSTYMKAPAAVVGMQLKHQQFVTMFYDITSKCQSSKTCPIHCGSEHLNCYLLDNNGFVMVSKIHKQTGRFYGEIDRNIMNALVQDNIYRRVHMVDYQAVCFDPIQTTDSASFLLTPLNHLRSIFAWTWSKILFFYFNYNLMSTGSSFNPSNDDDDNGEASNPIPPELVNNKTRPKPCDKEYYLFQLQPKRFAESFNSQPTPRKGKLYGCSPPGASPCNKSFVVHLVPHTNLILLAVEATCTCETSSFTLNHEEIKYNETQMCHWLSSNIYRRRPEQCVNYHEQELEIIGHCGRGVVVVPALQTIVLAAVVIRWLQHYFLSS